MPASMEKMSIYLQTMRLFLISLNLISTKIYKNLGFVNLFFMKIKKKLVIGHGILFIISHITILFTGKINISHYNLLIFIISEYQLFIDNCLFHIANFFSFCYNYA